MAFKLITAFMEDTGVQSRYSVAEEVANIIIHGMGVVYSIAGLAVLTTFASIFGTAWHVVSCSIFGATQILLYGTSTIYHSIKMPRAREVFRSLDHAAIFLMIAGTYTPFLLVTLRGPWGWSLLAVVWSLAFIGIAMQAKIIRLRPRLAVLPYILMGWVIIVAIKPLMMSIAPGGLALVVAGGLAYTLGVPFYVWKLLPFSHAVWHGFVLAGSMLHFFAILFYVIPLM